MSENHLKEIRHLALDLDGTLYLGKSLFPYTIAFLEALQRMEIGYTFFTNNSSRSDWQYVTRLREMGIDAALDDIYTSAHATIDVLRSDYPEVTRLFLLGTQGLRDQFYEAGYVICDKAPEAVVIGYDTELVYDRLCRAAWWIQQGCPFIATHPDLVCPTDRPLVLPDCGAICKLLEAATGRAPDAVPGKPDPAMLNGLRRRLGMNRSSIAMVGDRLYTDIAMARHAGVPGILVLSGETSRDELATAADQPDVVVEHVGRLPDMLKKARKRR